MGKRHNVGVTAEETKRVKESLAKSYPHLNVFEEESCVVVRGSFPVLVNGSVVDRYTYAIRLEVPPDYPASYPRLYEESGKIPKISDRHFDPKSGIACVFICEEWGWLREKCPTVAEFLSGPVNDFFVWQTSFDYHGRDILAARRHSLDGRIDFYREVLKTNQIESVIRGIEYLLRKEIKGHLPCYCGSNEKMRDCHFKDILSLRDRIPTELAREALEQIKKSIAPRFPRKQV
jgi:hypothetical protein